MGKYTTASGDHVYQSHGLGPPLWKKANFAYFTVFNSEGRYRMQRDFSPLFENEMDTAALHTKIGSMFCDIIYLQLQETGAIQRLGLMPDQDGLLPCMFNNTRDKKCLAIIEVLKNLPQVESELDIVNELTSLAVMAIPYDPTDRFEEVIIEWGMSLPIPFKTKWWLRAYLPEAWSAHSRAYARAHPVDPPRILRIYGYRENFPENPYHLIYPETWRLWRHGDPMDIDNDPLWQDKMNWNIQIEELKRSLYMLHDGEYPAWVDNFNHLLRVVNDDGCPFPECKFSDALRILLNHKDKGYCNMAHDRSEKFTEEMNKDMELNKGLAKIVLKKEIMLFTGFDKISVVRMMTGMLTDLWAYWIHGFDLYEAVKETIEDFGYRYVDTCAGWGKLLNKSIRFYCQHCKQNFATEEDATVDGHGCLFVDSDSEDNSDFDAESDDSNSQPTSAEMAAYDCCHHAPQYGKRNVVCAETYDGYEREMLDAEAYNRTGPGGEGGGMNSDEEEESDGVCDDDLLQGSGDPSTQYSEGGWNQGQHTFANGWSEYSHQ